MIVFVTDELPRPDAAGHLAFNYAILSWLRDEGHDVTILLTGMRLVAPLERYALARVAGPHVRYLGSFAVASPRAAGRIMSRVLVRCLPFGARAKLRQTRNQADAVLGKFPAQADLRWCARAVAQMRPKSVLVDTIFRAPLLAEPELAGVNAILLTHDVFHRRAEALKAAGYQVRPEGLTRERETALLMRATHIAAIQPEEAEILRRMCPRANVLTAPMPALPCPPPPETTRVAGRLVFVGSDSLPNLDGLRWFLSEIWPDLRGRGVTLDLIGDCGLALQRLPSGVNALGRVPVLAPFLHQAMLAISPLRVGSGLKIKLLDYARHGLFTVATPPSLQGFSTDPDSPFVIAGSAKMFADALLQRLAAPPPPETALEYVKRHYGTQSAFSELRAALSESTCSAR